MYVLCMQSLTFWRTLSSKRCSVCTHTGQRFDGRVCQKVKLSLDVCIPFAQSTLHTRDQTNQSETKKAQNSLCPEGSCLTRSQTN